MSTALALPELDSTFGCIFFAGIFTTALWGAADVQLYFYYEKYSKSDRLWLKLYIFLIWVLDTAYPVLLIQSLYVYFVKEFANILYLIRPERTLVDVSIFAALTDLLVQSLFVARIWNLSARNYVLTGIISAIVPAQLVATLVYFGQIYCFTESTQLLSVLRTERAMNAILVVADTAIAAALVFLLWRQRSGVRKTDSIIRRLVMYTIDTCLVTSVWGIVGLVGALAMPQSFVYLLVDLVIPKPYLNCMLASLNARSSLRGTLAEDSGRISIQLDGIRCSPSDATTVMDISSHNTPSPRSIKVKIDVDTSVGKPASEVSDIEAAISTS